ncbi:ribose 5-phosphate isomerase B [Planctomycetota bacterium]|nr:ribose 5-phosphate isomerase B [Planctomycetota bacterium]
MKINIASDHAAIPLRIRLAGHMTELGHEVTDFGPPEGERVDYPDNAKAACQELSSGDVDRVVLVCGSGIGMAMSANKIKNCRAAVLHNQWEGEMTRRHNNANVACFGARAIGEELAIASLNAFLNAEFEGDRHAGRVAKMDALD